jgi:hypothetical protein
MSCMSSTTMTVTSASMISDDPPYKLVFVFVCLCVYVDMCLYVVEPSGFRVLGFFRCLRRLLSINDTSLFLFAHPRGRHLSLTPSSPSAQTRISKCSPPS